MSELLRRALPAEASGDHVDDATLAAYLDGSLPDVRREETERHLAACARCTEDLAVAARVEREASAREASTPRLSPARAGRPSARRTWMRLAAGIVLVFGALLLGRAAGNFAARRLGPVLEDRLASWTARDVDVGRTSLLVAGGPGLALADLEIGDDPRFSEQRFATARSVSLRVEPSALLGGRLAGSIELDRPMVRLVRNPVGEWNVETLGGGDLGPRSGPGSVRTEIDRALDEAARGLPPRGAGEDALVELTAATVRDGVLEIADTARQGRTLRLHDVDLAYHGAPGQRGSLRLDGAVGPERDRVALRGEIGPFEGDAVPVYRFSEVELEGVPVAEIPGAPAAVLGRLTFGGRLESAGRALADIVAAARGSGELELCCGAFEGRNLVRDMVARLASLPGASAAAEAVTERAALASLLRDAATRYDRLAGRARLTPGTLHLTEVEFDSSAFRGVLDASIGLEGRLAAEGALDLAPELSAVLLAAAPALRPLADANGSVRLPFQAEGSWQNLRIEIDADQLLARLGSRTGPIALLRRPPRAALADSPLG